MMELQGHIMKKFVVSRIQEVTVDARDEQEAKEIGQDMFYAGEVDSSGLDVEEIDS